MSFRSLASAACLLALAAWGTTSLLTRSASPRPGESARVESPGAEANETDASEARLRGPELIREYFRQWHDPYPADLDRGTLTRIWEDIEALPREADGLSGRDDPGAGTSRGGFAPPWQPLGPFGMDTPQGGRNTGRIVDLNIGPDGLRAVAAASGGIWTRDPAGWQPRTDALTTQWSGSLDLHPGNANVMLVGTGEPFLRAGTGLWKSTDAGQTWAHKPMSPPPATCFRLRYAPNGTTVHGAFDLGYYRSTNGGETWTRTLDLGAWPTDLCLHPTDPGTLYLTVYGHGLFRSTNAGLTWNEMMGVGLPQADLGRGALSLCTSDPARMYVSWAHTNGSLLGTFRSTDAGVTWTDVSPHDYMWGQGWYNNTLACSPTDPDLVLAGGGELLRTTDAGATWTSVNDPALHVDYHASAWSSDGTEAWLGHDGGWSHSTDAGLTWSATDNTLAITQYVLVGAGAHQVPFVLGGGSQDNGLSVTHDGGTTWLHAIGGDGGGFAIHPTDPNIMYASLGLYGGAWTFRRLRSTNGGLNWTEINGGIGTASQWWIRIRNNLESAPLWYTYGDRWVFQTPGTFWFPMNDNTTPLPHFVNELTVSHHSSGTDAVYVCLYSDAPGQRLRVWDGATFEERSSGLPAGVRVRKAPTHPRQPDTAFALMNGLGTPGEKMFRTRDRGALWTNITGNLPDLPLADLVAHPVDDDRLFLGSEMGVFQTTNGGTTWERWHLGLPEAAVITEFTFVDRFDQTGEFWIIAGTYGRGMWAREVGSATSGAPDAAGSGGARLPVLHAGAPNPFGDVTALSFTLPRAMNVSLRLFDASGRQVAGLAEGPHAAGLHRVHVEGRHLGAGVYFARLEAAGVVRSTGITHIDRGR